MGMAALTPCSLEMAGFYDCLVAEPLKHWECGDDGVAVIREGFCDAEQRKALQCMEAKMSP
jgi:hypothetical protein